MVYFLIGLLKIIQRQDVVVGFLEELSLKVQRVTPGRKQHHPLDHFYFPNSSMKPCKATHEKQHRQKLFSNFQPTLNTLVAQFHPEANTSSPSDHSPREKRSNGREGRMATRLNNGGPNKSRKTANSDGSGFTHSSFVVKAIKFIFRQLNFVMCNAVMKHSLSVGSRFKTLGGAGDVFTETS